MPRRAALSSVLLLLSVCPISVGYASAQENRTHVPTHEQTLTAIAACGVPAAKVRITYENELQSDLVRIGDLGGTDEARFRCLRKSVHPVYIVDVSSADQSAAYTAFENREDWREAKAAAVAWLSARGKLGKVPRYDRAGGTAKFARAVEAVCSVREGTALETYGESGLTYRRSFVEKSIHSDPGDRFACLQHMIAASDADEHDVRLMLIGNEAYQTEPQR